MTTLFFQRCLGMMTLLGLSLALQSCQLNGFYEQSPYRAEQTACWFKGRALQDAQPTRVTNTAEQHFSLLHLDTLILETRPVNDGSQHFCDNLRRRPVTASFDLSQHPVMVAQVNAKQIIYGYVEKPQPDAEHLGFKLIRLR